MTSFAGVTVGRGRVEAKCSLGCDWKETGDCRKKHFLGVDSFFGGISLIASVSRKSHRWGFPQGGESWFDALRL